MKNVTATLVREAENGAMQESLRDRLERMLTLVKMESGRIYSDIWHELLDCGEGDVPFAEWLFVPARKHLNNYGGLHGGIISAVFDTYMGMTASGITGRPMSTISMTVNYLSAGLGKRYSVRIEYPHVGHRVVSCYAVMTDMDSRRQVASCTAQFSVLAHLPETAVADVNYE